MSREACVLAVEEDRIDHCVHFSVLGTAYRGLYEKYGLNRPDGQLFVSPSLQTSFLVFNHDRPAFKGPGQIPLKKAINFAIDRPELTRPSGYLAGKRTDQMLPPALGRAVSIYPLGGPEPRGSTPLVRAEHASSRPPSCSTLRTAPRRSAPRRR